MLVGTSRKQGQRKIGRARSGKVGTLRAFFTLESRGGGWGALPKVYLFCQKGYLKEKRVEPRGVVPSSNCLPGGSPTVVLQSRNPDFKFRAIP